MSVPAQRPAAVPEVPPPGRDDHDVLPEPGSHEVPEGDETATCCPLDSYLDGVQERWREVQASFMDDPNGAVERADGLLDEVTNAACALLTGGLADLRDDWKNADAHDTEVLRAILCDYRAQLEQTLRMYGAAPGSIS